METKSHKRADLSDNILDALNIQLLEKFKMYNSNGHNLFCSYMFAGNKYSKELLVIGREQYYWWKDFSIEELRVRGPEYIYKNKVRLNYNNVFESSCHRNFVTEFSGNIKKRSKYKTLFNPLNDPFSSCINEIAIKLGICENEKIWSSYIALTYLYKIAYSSKTYLLEKLRINQFEFCKEMFQMEMFMLKPKRVLFLTGMKHAQDFLNLTDCSGLEDCVCNLGEFDYGFHKAQTVVSVNPKKYHRKKLVNLILKGFN